MKYLLMALILTACNFGLVDIQEKPKPCYDRKLQIGADSLRIDSTAKDCGTTEITTPFDHVLDPVIP